jgi:DNA-binding MarR family transcriptional regulator
MKKETRKQAQQIHRTAREFHRELMRICILKLRSKQDDGLDACPTLPQLNTMMVVRDNTEISVRDLATALQVSAPSVSTMVDRLVEMGMLQREQAVEDRRQVCIRLSEQGASQIQDIEDGILNGIAYLLEKLGPRDAQQWCEIYNRIYGFITTEEPALFEGKKAQ